MTRRVVITGTDTGVGKTHVACWIARELAAAGLRPGIYKPVCSGAEQSATGPVWDDVERLHAALQGRFPRVRISPQQFHAPLAPPTAAVLEGRTVDEELLSLGADWFEARVDLLLVEGAGGWLSPLSSGTSLADLSRRWSCPVLIVARQRLGAINHALLTIESIRSRGLSILGVILNEVPAERAAAITPDIDFAASNLAEIESRGGVPGLGVLLAGMPERLVRFGNDVEIDWKSVLLDGAHRDQTDASRPARRRTLPSNRE